MSSRSVVWAGLLLLLGCGPGLLGDFDGGGGTDDTSGPDTGDTATSSGGAVDEGGLGGEGALDGTDSGGDDDGPPPLTECWLVEDLFVVPAEYPVQVADQDGDGTAELWIFERVDTGPGPGQTIVHSLDGAGDTLSTTEPGSRAFGLVDGDGNGFADLLTASLGGGGPPSLGFLASSMSGQFGAKPIPFEIQFGDPFVGFLDVTGDAIMDVLRFGEDARVALQIGTGDGGFTEGGGFEFLGDSFAVAHDIVGVPGRFTLQPIDDFEPGPGGGPPECARGPYWIFDGSSGSLTPVASQAEGEESWGRLLASAVDGQVLYVDVCDAEAQTRGIATLAVDGDRLRQVVVQEGLRWSAVGDFDGDGIADALWAADANSPVSYQRGLDGGGFAGPTVTNIPVAEVDPARMFTADFQGNGRQTLVRAVAPPDPDNRTQLQYQSVALSLCPD